MIPTINLTLPVPPSANAYWRAARGRGLVPSHEALAYRAKVRQVARGVRPLMGNCRVSAHVYRARKIGDLDNALKALFDALNGVAWLDDSQVIRIEACRWDDAGDPRVVVVIDGERWATKEEAVEHAAAKAEARKKRRATVARNRAARAFGGRAQSALVRAR